MEKIKKQPNQYDKGDKRNKIQKNFSTDLHKLLL